MADMTRRGFLKTLGAGSIVWLSGIPSSSWGANANVVVVGGGSGGATVAKYLKKADSSINVTLIEKNADYYTCYMSNEVIGGDRELSSLKFGYDDLRTRYGINVVIDEVSAIDPVTKKVTTSTGQEFLYDRCVVSPGIDFHYDAIDGFDENLANVSIPHAWKAGAQTTLLRNQLEAMQDGGTFVLAAPPNPFRCPPAPYERASQVAHYFKQYKPNSKIVIVDPKTAFAKQSSFEQGWMNLYGYGSDNSMIEWVSGQGVTALDSASKTVTSVDENGTETQYQADVLNLVPAQKAGKIAFDAGLADDSGWCPVSLDTFESTLHADIHVIGDSCSASPLPKSGFAANSEAKACALSIAALLNNREPGRTSFTNGCYSIVGKDYAISIVAVYELSEDGRQIMKMDGAGGTTPADASEADLKLDVEYAYSWYNNFTSDIFK